VGGLGALLSLGCFFELADVEDPLLGVGGAGNGGSAATGGGVMVGGGSVGVGGNAGDSPCPPGQKDCGEGCVAFSVDNGCGNPSCAPCAALPQASPSCNGDTNLCQFATCDEGFADCDGDTSTYTGAASGNGCEYAFGPGGVIRSVPPPLLDVPLAPINISDQSRDDWAGVPAYPLVETCDNCVDDALPDVTAKNEVPPRSDLDAYFRVAWDQDFFYVLADVFDGALVSNGADNSDGRCQNGALCEDAMSVFFDGRNNRAQVAGYGIDDSRVFLGLGGKAFRVSGAPVQTEDVDLSVNLHGAACYRIEAQFSWSFIVGVQGNASELVGQFPPAVNQEYGFDISVNDWDPGVSDQTARRESQLFWRNPGADYQRVTSGFGPIRLTEAVSALEAPQ
jgi:Carbohydrate family 9 binding domain-like